MDLLAQILVNGILLSGLYAVMAIGLALVWGVLNIVNLAHGAFIMLGAYASWYLYTDAHIDPFLGLPITAIGMFALGYLLQRGLLNPYVIFPMLHERTRQLAGRHVGWRAADVRDGAGADGRSAADDGRRDEPGLGARGR